MINLVVDIGNSSVKWSFADDTTLLNVGHLNGDNIIEELLSIVKREQVDSVAIASVRNLTKEYFNPLEPFCKRVLFVDHNIKLPHIEHYPSKKSIGADRVMATLAAIKLFPLQNILLFDFGTALTIDSISKEGELIGGNISPGLESRFKVLHTATKQLPLVVKSTALNESFGKTTIEAIENGVAQSLLYEVEGYLNRSPSHLPIFTGGDAIYFAKKMKSAIFVVYNLVLMGLAHLATNYANKK